MTNPIKVMKIRLFSSIGTVFEQYKDLNAFLGAEISYDDLTTVDTASDNLKKQSGL